MITKRQNKKSKKLTVKSFDSDEFMLDYVYYTLKKTEKGWIGVDKEYE
ncbi:hypothetical protein ciss_07750 [Carboxydothermus islandicus]|uniref:Uncharacterized protein n=1 Tax=Carboxydothermus islandicus TaxID=661089 RepID=A0A1L8D106_9THEO|nr:hypothetical protein ciss_07750 [Carboxydothermus islandicus]